MDFQTFIPYKRLMGNIFGLTNVAKYIFCDLVKELWGLAGKMHTNQLKLL